MFLYVSSIKYKKSDIKNMITTATEGGLPVITLGYPGRGGKGNGESLEPGRRHLRGKNKLRLSRLG